MDKQNDIEKFIITEAEKEEFGKRIMDWLSDENLEKAIGKTSQEIFDEFDCVLPQPIAYIPEKYMVVFDEDIVDNRVYSSMAYFIDHAVNNHPNINKERYLLIQEVLNDPDEIKEIVREKVSFAFVKKIDRYNAVVIQLEKSAEGKIIWHKSFFDQNKMPYASEKYKSIRPISSEGGVSSIIHAENSAHGSSLPARDDDAKLDIFSDMEMN